MNHLSRLLGAACVAVLAAACSDEGGGTGPAPQDRLELSKATLVTYKGSVDTLRATVYGGTGAPVNTPVTWTSADTLIAKVDAEGVLRARNPGQVVVTATAGTLTGTVAVTVNDDVTPPVVSSASASTAAVDLAGNDTSITFTLNVQDGQSGVGLVHVELFAPTNVSLPMAGFSCTDTLPRAGTRQDGTWSCTFPFNRYLPPGQWRATASVHDRASGSTGRSFTFQVSGSRPDVAGPQLGGLTLLADSVNVRDGAARVLAYLRVADMEAGVAGAQLVALPVTGTGGFSCGSVAHPRLSQDGTRRVVDLPCEIRIPQNDPAAEWYVQRVVLHDLRGNERTVTEAELRAAGFKTRIRVTR